MSLRDKMCEAGAANLREFMCTPTGGGDVIINYYGTTEILEEEGAKLMDDGDIIQVEEQVLIVEEPANDIIIDDTNIVQIEDTEVVDGIC